MLPLIILAGPTASEKSETAVALAEELGSEIISADSVQVYKYFDVGSAKPSLETRQKVVHHLIDVLEPDEVFSAFDFKTRALKIIPSLVDKGQTPILAGGTGLYMKTLMEDYDCAVQASPEIKLRVHEEIEKNGLEAVYQKLTAIDPASAKKIQPNDSFRVERALSVYYQTGQTLSEFHEREQAPNSKIEAQFFFLDWERKLLYERIEARIDSMMERGLVEEVESLLSRGISRNSKPFKSIGYSQIVNYLDDKISRERAVYEIKRETRRYAKRQLTWFRKVKDSISIPASPADRPRDLKDKILARLPLLACLVLGLFLLAGSPPQAEASMLSFDEGLRFYGQGDFAKAENHFKVMRNMAPDSALGKQALFLLGKIRFANGEFGAALETWQSALSEYEILEDYIRYETAHAYLRLDRESDALNELDLLVKTFPESRVYPEARALQARLLEKAGKTDAAIGVLGETIARLEEKTANSEFKNRLPDLIWREGLLLAQAGKQLEAFKRYRRLYIDHPAHAVMSEALPKYRALENIKGAPALSQKEAAKRIRLLLANVQNEDAVKEIQRWEKKSSPLPPSFYFYYGRAYKGLGKREQSIEKLTEFLKAYPEHKRTQEAKLKIGYHYWNLNRDPKAIEYFGKALSQNEQTRWAQKAHFLLGRVYEDAGNEKESFKHYSTLARGTQKSIHEEKAGWRIAWAFYIKGKYPEALKQFEDNAEKFPQGDLAEENLFWRAKALEKLERGRESQKVYSRLIQNFPLGFYGLQARNKMGDGLSTLLFTSAGPKIRKASYAPAPQSPKASRPKLAAKDQARWVRAREFISMGLMEDAQYELRSMPKGISSNLSGALWLAELYNAAEAYSESIRLLYLFRGVARDEEESELSIRFWKNLYPPAYSGIIEGRAESLGVDPNLVRGIIQQESMFDPKALSRAGARGLMQIMPQTGERLLLKYTGENRFDVERLFDPGLNIQMGIHYLNELGEQFEYNPIHMLICYNAGPSALQRWIKRVDNFNESDLAPELIPYPETKKYVKNVLRNYGVYKMLYGEEVATSGSPQTQSVIKE